jgi:hypothetical protein
MRWRPVTTFFQSLVDMKNAQTPGSYRAWAPDYRTDLPRFLSEVYDVPTTPERLTRIEEALQLRERVRERLFAGKPEAPAERSAHILHRGRCATGQAGRLCAHAGEP